MFRPTNPQLSLMESRFLVTPRKRERLERSWAGAFRTRVLPLIDEESFRPYFHVDNGRPNTSIRLLIGLHLLKEADDLTDEQILDALEFNLQWQHALGVEPADAHVCEKTLHNFRHLLMKHGQAQALFETLTVALMKADGLSAVRQRLDSTHVLSNIAVLTRLGLFTETLLNFLRDLRKDAPEKLAKLDASYAKRYLDREGYFADAKREQARRRLGVVGEDLYALVRAFEHDSGVSAWPSYALLVRLLAEQCEVIPPKTPEAPVSIALASTPPAEVAPTPPVEAEEAPLEPAPAPPVEAEKAPLEPAPAPPVEAEKAPLEPAPAPPVEAEKAAIAGSLPQTEGTVPTTAPGAPEPATPDGPECPVPATPVPSIVLKEGKEISGASLQSPHDPDATYGHKGKGYEAQLVETCVEGNPYQVITAVLLTPANGSDQNAAVPLVQNLLERDLGPEAMLGDTGFGSGENIAAYAELGVALVAPVRDPHAPDAPDAWGLPVEGTPAGRPPSQPDPEAPLGLGAFTFNPTYDEVVACPAGHAPRSHEIVEAKKPYRSTFDGHFCATCPLADRCPTRIQKDANGDRVLAFRDVQAATATRQREQQTPAFKKGYRLRSGIESANAELKGRHGAGDLRVRGQERVDLAIHLKVLALNVKRAVQHHVETLRAEWATAAAAVSPA